jgi:hypothetical protein
MLRGRFGSGLFSLGYDTAMDGHSSIISNRVLSRTIYVGFASRVFPKCFILAEIIIFDSNSNFIWK